MEESISIIDNSQDEPLEIDNPGVSSNSGNPDEGNSQDKGDSDKEELTYKKRYEDSSREVSRLQQIDSDTIKSLDDGEYFLGLGKKAGAEVVKRAFNIGMTDIDNYDEMVAILKSKNKGEKSLPEDPKEARSVMLEEARAEARAEIQIEKANEIVDKAVNKFDEASQEVLRDEFEDVLGNRKLTPKFAEREIKKIIMFHTRKSGKNYDEALANMSSNSLRSSKSSSKKAPVKGSVLKSMGFSQEDQKKYFGKKK